MKLGEINKILRHFQRFSSIMIYDARENLNLKTNSIN